jgi:hypothetical protein
MITQVVKTRGKIVFRFGADTFQVTRSEAVRLAVEALTAAGAVPIEAVVDGDGVLLVFDPGRHNFHIEADVADALAVDLGDAADEARVPVELREIDVVSVNADQIIAYRKDEDWFDGGDAA